MRNGLGVSDPSPPAAAAATAARCGSRLILVVTIWIPIDIAFDVAFGVATDDAGALRHSLPILLAIRLSLSTALELPAPLPLALGRRPARRRRSAPASVGAGSDDDGIFVFLVVDVAFTADDHRLRMLRRAASGSARRPASGLAFRACRLAPACAFCRRAPAGTRTDRSARDASAAQREVFLFLFIDAVCERRQLAVP